NASAQHRLQRRGHADPADLPREAIRPTLAHEDAGLEQRPNSFLEKERVALGPVGQEPLEGPKLRSVAQETTKQLLGGRWRQGVDPELAVGGLSAPAVLVLGPVVDEEQQARRREALHEAVEEGLGLRVDPVEVLEDGRHGLHLALPKKQPLDAVEGALPPPRGVERPTPGSPTSATTWP